MLFQQRVEYPHKGIIFNTEQLGSASFLTKYGTEIVRLVFDLPHNVLIMAVLFLLSLFTALLSESLVEAVASGEITCFCIST